MHRRRLLSSLTWAGVGVVAAACGARIGDSASDGTSSSNGPSSGGGGGQPSTGDDAADGSSDHRGGDHQADASGADRGGATSDTDEEDAGSSRPRVEVLCRDAVGLRPPAASSARHTLDRLTLHHTAVGLQSAADAPERLRRHQRHHQSQGWSDIAYHYAVDLAGNVYELRHPSVPGDTFTDYDTTGHLHVVCEGDFERQVPTDALLQGTAGLLAALAHQHRLDPATLGSHRTYVPSTACPGRHLQAELASLRTEARRQLAAAPRLEVRCGSLAADRVAAIEAG